MFKLPALNYEYDALEPFIDERTMMIHHDKHHQSYVDKLNTALEKYPQYQDKSIKRLLVDLDKLPVDIQTAVQNNGGGHANHSLFWNILSADGGELEGDLFDALELRFGSIDQFKDEFFAAALGRFGAGWAWLVVDDDGDLQICSTPNQDSPLLNDETPLLGVDVWEHAYYLKYQNRRDEYIKAFFNIINWHEVARRLKEIS